MAKILVADDGQEIRTVTRVILSRAGHTVIEAADGAAGLAWFKQHDVDLVIVDIVMPVLNGLALIDRVRQLRPGALILVITAGGGDARHGKDAIAVALGTTPVLTKPFLVVELIDAVETLLAGGARELKRPN